jgi:hypothetical protein
MACDTTRASFHLLSLQPRALKLRRPPEASRMKLLFYIKKYIFWPITGFAFRKEFSQTIFENGGR